MDFDANTTELPILGAAAIGVSIVVILLMVAILGAFASVLGAPVTTIDPVPGSAVQVGDGGGSPQEATISTTRGNAVELNDTGYVALESAPSLAGSPWTVCAWADVEDGATAATMDLAAFDNGDVQLEWDAGSWAVYYDDGSADAYVRADAASTGPTTVCGRWDGADLTLIVDGSVVGSDTLTTTAASRNVSVTWEGRVDEVRAVDAATSTSRLQTYAENPTIPLDSSVARLMFDEGSGTVTTVYYQPDDATLNGDVRWVAGVESPTLVRGEDYTADTNPFTITALEGGRLDDAPVAYVATSGNDFAGSYQQTAQTGNRAFVVLSITLIVVPVGVAVVLLISGVTASVSSTRGR